MLHRIIVTLPAAAVILSLASGQNPKSDGSYGEGTAFGPFGVPLTRYNELLNSPNATSQYPLLGPNISAPYPGSGNILNGWSWVVSVAADIPLSESNSTTADWYPDNHNHNHTFTGSRVVLQQAPTTGPPAHESWFVCVVNWDIDLATYPSKLRTDDGSCSSVLSEQCIRDTEASVLEEYRLGLGGPNPCKCPSLTEIASCEGEQAKALMSGGGCAAGPFNATAIRNWPDGKLDVRQFGGPPHKARNLTAYNETGSLAWPVLAVWGPSTNNTRNSTGQIDFSGAVAKLSCVRAKDATPGSKTPGGGTVSVGNREAVVSSTILVASVVWVGSWVAFL
ncbi:uncharacterized protein B0T15DRAFT_325586 [Chaetomium strumarium]|uniref:Uncharacterized protein n=1 Tax=Chaetomium strumarium TaxID=1170767 RepID=A0AAJ0LY15_9PEZI|nr:hypothetical protein B0T15DRAFT_325586 [Chaetomium strumarium]